MTGALSFYRSFKFKFSQSVNSPLNPAFYFSDIVLQMVTSRYASALQEANGYREEATRTRLPVNTPQGNQLRPRIYTSSERAEAFTFHVPRTLAAWMPNSTRSAWAGEACGEVLQSNNQEPSGHVNHSSSTLGGGNELRDMPSVIKNEPH